MTGLGAFVLILADDLSRLEFPVHRKVLSIGFDERGLFTGVHT